MYKLQLLNITVETDSDVKKDELISKGYELVEKIKEKANIKKEDESSQAFDEDSKKDKKNKK